MRARLLAVLLFASMFCSCATAWSAALTAEPYDALVTASHVNPPGDTEWAYAITNTSPSSDYTIWLVQIEVDEQTDVVSVTTPTGWVASLEVPHIIMWSCTSGELPAGQSLTGFRARYEACPTYQGWTAMFNNINVPGDTPVDFGDVSVPEPGSIFVLITGLASLAAHIAGRKQA